MASRDVPIICDCGHLFRVQVPESDEFVESYCPECGCGQLESVEDALETYEEYMNKLCPTCNGSGEGQADGTTCRVCKGSGSKGGWR